MTLNSTHSNRGSLPHPVGCRVFPSLLRVMARTSLLIFWEVLPQTWRTGLGWGAEVVNIPQQIYVHQSLLRMTFLVQLSILKLRSTVSLDGAAYKKSIQEWVPAFEGVTTNRRQVSGVSDGAEQNQQNRSILLCAHLSTPFDILIALLLPHRSTLKPQRMASQGHFLLLWDWRQRIFWT